MAWFIARHPDETVRAVNDGKGLAEIYSLIDRGWTIYRVMPAGNQGRFTLIPQRVNPASVVTGTITVGGTLEDS